ncbi:hypothetical protein [Saccharospirillum salsuginis]|uniref:Uncharacterized protein n=1 Tax=Saccharospirillum salsuginis TaxID=418750 RepID=A0A918NGU0_9GAMM|nr:hypothetical protein [Saccharospirillum salsuginis]GGX66586.1 hypothetical protein GCM10007392_37890 [Saccharospirillum salsuginis]
MNNNNPLRRRQGTLKRHFLHLFLLGLCCAQGVLADEASFDPFVPVAQTEFPPIPVYAETLQAIRLHQLAVDQFYQHELRMFSRRLEDYRLSLEEARQALEREREEREQPSIEAWERKEALRLSSVDWELKRQDLEKERDAMEAAFEAGSIGRDEYEARFEAYRKGIAEYKAFHDRYASARRAFDREHEAFQRYLEEAYRPAIAAYRSVVRTSLEPQQERRRLLLARFEERKAWCRSVIQALQAVEQADERRALLEKLKAEAGA